MTIGWDRDLYIPPSCNSFRGEDIQGIIGMTCLFISSNHAELDNGRGRCVESFLACHGYCPPFVVEFSPNTSSPDGYEFLMQNC
jgi:hypothetical protein